MKYRIEWRWNCNWRMDDEPSWLTKDEAISEATLLYAKKDEKLTETRVMSETGKVVWHSDELSGVI